MNLYGRYNIYRDDKLVIQSPNLITDNGKSIILQYLGGTISDWATMLAVGAVATTASVSDYKMAYEIMRLPVSHSVPIDSVTITTTGSGTVNTSSVRVTSPTGLAIGQSVYGGGVTSSATPTITSISGSSVFITHPVETTFSGSTLTFKSVKSVRFRTRVGAGLAFRIYELGMFNEDRLQSDNSLDAKILTNFNEGVTLGGWSSGSSASVSTDSGSYSPRLGAAMLKITPSSGSPASAVLSDPSTVPTVIGASTSTAGGLLIPTTNFSSSYDTAKLLVYSSASGASITITGQDSTTGLTTNTITILPKSSVPAGLSVVEGYIAKGSTYNDNLTKIQVSASVSSGSVDLYLDSLKLSKTEELSVYNGMVSRSALATPIAKDVEETIDIEYEIFLFP